MAVTPTSGAGNQVYRDSFPGVLFVSHNNTRTDLVTLGAPNRKGTVQAGPGFVARFKQLLAQGLGDDSTPVVQRERAAMESTVRVGEQYFAEAPGFREVLATLTFDHEVTLYPVMHDDAYLRSVSSMLTAVVDLTRAAVSDGKTIEQVRATVTLPDFRASVAGEDKWLNSMFTHFFLNPTVTRAYEDATRARK